MATPLIPNKPSLLKTPHVPGGPAGSPDQIFYRKGDFHQGGVFGDGKGSKSGDERKGEIRYTYKHIF